MLQINIRRTLQNISVGQISNIFDKTFCVLISSMFPQSIFNVYPLKSTLNANFIEYFHHLILENLSINIENIS